MKIKKKRVVLTSMLLISVLHLVRSYHKSLITQQEEVQAIQQIGRVDVGTAYAVAVERNLAAVTCNGVN